MQVVIRKGEFMEQHDKGNSKASSGLTGNINRIKTAVALSYDPEDEAPKVLASGRGYLAEKIIRKAKEADIPLHQDEKLANTLSKLEIGDMIPKELYEVVAEVLLFVDKMDRIKGKVYENE
jgi:flagellar biosynthesis protein